MERMDRLRLTLTASIDELERVAERVEAFNRANGFDARFAYALRLICDEWITNIVMHGYGGQDAKPPDAPERGAADGSGNGTARPDIEVLLELADEGTVRLTFTDGGPPFNPLTKPEADVSLPLEKREIGGLGIHFLKRLTDRWEYERIDGRNRLTLTKSIRDRNQEDNDGDQG